MENQIFTLSAVFLFFFSQNTFSQCGPPDGGASHHRDSTMTKPGKCMVTINGSYSETAWQLIDSGLVDGNKNTSKFRSVFVNGKINDEGGFAYPHPIGGGDYTAHPNVPGSALAVDEDGDCVFQRENNLLNWCVDNEMDEILLYNVSKVLTNGDEIVKSVNSSQVQSINEVIQYGTINDINNTIGVEESFEWHLARFIRKAKNWNGSGFDVKAVLPEGSTNWDSTDYDKFYIYHHENSRWGGYLEGIEELDTLFYERYKDLWLTSPGEVTYLDYGEDTLFFPRDNQGRISQYDKAITDIYNYKVFQMRAQYGYIAQHTSGDCTDLYEGNSCDNAFDGHVFDWEWFNNPKTDDNDGNADPNFYPDQELDALIGMAAFSRSFDTVSNCFPSIEVVQNIFDDDEWVNGGGRTSQQRADTVDKYFDRIYLYSYHKNPCDCYSGRASSSNEERFRVKIDYLNNNGYGKLPGNETDVVPVFHGEEFDPVMYYDTSYLGGCDSGNYDSDVYGCDYECRRSGTALQHMRNRGLNAKLGHVENIFQLQYDLAANETGNSDNHITGYGWFKSSFLEGKDGETANDVLLSLEKMKRQKTKENLSIYPNPSKGKFTIELNGNSTIQGIQVFSLNGNLVREITPATNRFTVNLDQSGVYLMKIITNNKVYNRKVIKL